MTFQRERINTFRKISIEDPKMYIYKITNIINKKVYVGLETGKPLSRWNFHRKSYKQGGQAIHAAMRKHGEENFICEIIDKADNICELVIKEVEWIARLNSFGVNGYNNSPGGELTLDISISDITEEDLNKLSEIRSNMMKNVNNIRWSRLSDDEKKDFSKKHLHSPEANLKRSKTITDQWNNMGEETRNKKLRGLKTQWNDRTIEEKHKITSRSNGLFSPKKWKIVWENGTEEILENGLSQFCKKLGLIPQNVRGYANSDRTYKGLFKVYRL